MSDRRTKACRYFDRHRDYMDDFVKNGIETNRRGFGRIQIKDADGRPVKGASVHLTLKNHAFKFGCNIFMLDEFETPEKNAAYRENFKKTFNYATVPFYWSDLEPTQGKPRYEKDSPKVYRRPAPDLCVEYCRENGIRMKGHCLAYDTSCFSPSYLSRDPRTAKKQYDAHFKQIAERYADVIDDFDITNELLCPDILNAAKPTILKEDDYLDFMFSLGMKYFPYNRRFLNEACRVGEQEMFGNRTPYYMLIERLIKNGGAINGVSYQAHSFFGKEAEEGAAAYRYNPVHTIAQMLQYTDFRLPMQISEVTLPAYGLSKEDEDVQAELLTNMYRMWFAAPYMEGIVYWNLVDGYAAFAPQGTLEGENYFCGGLYRYDMTEKPALRALRALLAEWQTDVTVTTDDAGEAVFKGFYGSYDAAITTEGKRTEVSFALDKAYERPFSFTV